MGFQMNKKEKICLTFNFLSWFPLSWKRVEADDKNHHDRNNNWKNDDDDCIVFSCKIHEINLL